MPKDQGKLLTKKLIKVHKQNINQGVFLKTLPWLVIENFYCKSFYLFLSQNCVQKYLLSIRPKGKK